MMGISAYTSERHELDKTLCSVIRTVLNDGVFTARYEMNLEFG
jgi:hypothetical protein